MIDRPHDSIDATDVLIAIVNGTPPEAAVQEFMRAKLTTLLPGASAESLAGIYERTKDEIARRKEGLTFAYDVLKMVERERKKRGLANDASTS